ncbi:MAG: hypothetical protein IKP77_06025 [Acholeplasmatales bacterium]|nr:hypothetical protein [Acholeplasmatales bacterium]
MEFTKWVDEQSKAVKILLFFPIWGWIFGFLYRLFKFIETSDTATLIGMILFIIPFTGFILSIVDLVFIITEGKVKVLVVGGENFGINGTVSSNEENKEETKAEETKTDDVIDAEVTEAKTDDTKTE